MNYTKESIAKLLESRKRKNERLKLLEKKRKKREKEKLRKAKKLMRQTLEKINKAEEEKKRKNQDEIERKKLFSFNLFHIYSSRFVERENDEDDLYTLDELKNIEELYPNETGRINWSFWNQVVSETKKNISTLINQYEHQKP